MKNHVLCIIGFLAVMVFFPASIFSEDADLASRVQRLELQIRELAKRIYLLQQGGFTGSWITMTSAVDLDCVQSRKLADPNPPDSRVIEGWLISCRNLITSGLCQQVEANFDLFCFEKAKNLYPYQADANVLNAFSAACNKIQFRCPGAN